MALIWLLLLSCAPTSTGSDSRPLAGQHLPSNPRDAAEQILSSTRDWANRLDRAPNGYPLIISVLEDNPDDEQLTRALRQALEETHFHTPGLWETGLDPATRRVEVDLLRALQSWAAEDTERWTIVLQLAARHSGHADLVGQMLAQRLMGQAFSVLQSQLPQDISERKKLLALLEALPLDENDFVRALDIEFCFGWRALKGSRDEVKQEELLARRYLGVRAQLENQTPPTEFKHPDRATPESLTMAELLTPHYHQAYQEWFNCWQQYRRLRTDLARLE